jgi:ketosteroid isomerase-like protein
MGTPARTAYASVMVGIAKPHNETTMGTEHPNATAYRMTADAFRAGDITALRSLIDEDVVWHVPGQHAMAGAIRGLDDLVTWLGRLRALGFTLREHDVFGNDEHVCALSYMGARRPGLDVEVRVTSVFHFRAGKQVERWLYPEDMAVWETIFGN